MNKRKVKKDVKKSILVYLVEACPAGWTIAEVYEAFKSGIVVFSELEGNGAKPIVYGNRVRHIRWSKVTANHPPPSVGSPVPLSLG